MRQTAILITLKAGATPVQIDRLKRLIEQVDSGTLPKHPPGGDQLIEDASTDTFDPTLGEVVIYQP
jgi:hypothetical protein